ncbi:MAG: lytic transglycosylase domain-containing protein [Clostridiales bacterium]|nr:lytic transglycosylase domain-containing protein [Clostridiales bacterium]
MGYGIYQKAGGVFVARNVLLRNLFIFVLVLFLLICLVFFGSTWYLKKMYPLRYKEIVLRYSSVYELDPYLVFAVIWVESKFDKMATSRKDARGLMQIVPSTGSWAAEKLGIEGYDDDSLYNPDINIQIGCWYINNLQKQFGDMNLALAAYNGGSGNVRKWLKDTRYSKDGKTLDDIPFNETKNFVNKVWRAYNRYKQLYRL